MELIAFNLNVSYRVGSKGQLNSQDVFSVQQPSADSLLVLPTAGETMLVFNLKVFVKVTFAASLLFHKPQI